MAKTYTFLTPDFWGAPYLNMKDLIGKAEEKKEEEKDNVDGDFQGSDDEEDN